MPYHRAPGHRTIERPALTRRCSRRSCGPQGGAPACPAGDPLTDRLPGAAGLPVPAFDRPGFSGARLRHLPGPLGGLPGDRSSRPSRISSGSVTTRVTVSSSQSASTMTGITNRTRPERSSMMIRPPSSSSLRSSTMWLSQPA